MPWLDVDLEDEDGVALQKGKYLRTDRRDIEIAVVQLPHIANFTDFNALAAQPDVRVRYVRQPQELAGVDMQARRQGVPVLGVCGGYQMLGETIIDEVESGLGTQPGLGLLNTVTHFAQHKTTTQVTATLAPGLPAWLAATAGLAVRGYEIHMGETELRDGCRSLMQLHKNGLSVADGAVSDDGLAFGTYLHGLFDSDEFTRALVNGLRQRKGLAALDSDFEYAQYKSRQFDLLADAMRQYIDIEKIYAIMRQHQEPIC